MQRPCEAEPQANVRAGCQCVQTSSIDHQGLNTCPRVLYMAMFQTWFGFSVAPGRVCVYATGDLIRALRQHGDALHAMSCVF